jgi:hypothetical protein
MQQEIKLLKIHKRRKEVLEEQITRIGRNLAPAHLLTETADIDEQVEEIETNLKRRLQALREKLAIQGINADPSLSIEAEDIEEYFKE